MNKTLGLCLDTLAVAPSQYAGLNFDSLCEFQGKLIGGSDAGIFSVQDPDAPDDYGVDITSYFQLASSDFGLPNQKKIRKVALSGLLSDPLYVTVWFDNGAFTATDFSVHSPVSQHTIEFLFDADQLGKYIALRVDNIAGGDFAIESIAAMILPTVFKFIDEQSGTQTGRAKVAVPSKTIVGAGTIS
jgi:hypothetical protein